MKEVERKFRPMTVPPDYCRGCNNRFTDVCLNECAPAGDLHKFAPKPISFSDRGALPTRKEWEKFTTDQKYEWIKQRFETLEQAIEVIVNTVGIELDQPVLATHPYNLRSKHLSTYLRDTSVEASGAGEAPASEGQREAIDGGNGGGLAKVYRAQESK